MHDWENGRLPMTGVGANVVMGTGVGLDVTTGGPSGDVHTQNNQR